MATEAFAPTKINLTLHVTGQRADGYHLLDSLVVFADVGDRLRLDPADHMTLEITGPFADGVPADRRNLVWRAAELLGVTSRILHCLKCAWRPAYSVLSTTSARNENLLVLKFGTGRETR